MKPPTASQIKGVINGFAHNSASLVIPILQAIQEKFGYVPPESLKAISRHTGVGRNKIYGILTFYAQFTTIPRGKYIVKPCRGTACHVRGANNVINHIKSKLNIEDGQTTPDYKFSLETVACLGTCFLAPAMMVNQDYYGNLDEKRIDEALKECT
ncbi:MAG: NADH-quinone oxidoreductase subunit NuoE [Planctomycetes bacterium]|nr:NADH-quinone oxidoreductase subunit NuoE [Planctomycetota bacterium]